MLNTDADKQPAGSFVNCFSQDACLNVPQLTHLASINMRVIYYYLFGFARAHVQVTL